MAEEKAAAAKEAMGWLDWSASVIGSLAWPVAAVIIAWLFRSQIAALLAKVKQVRWGDAVVDLSEKLDQIEAVALEVKAEAAEEARDDATSLATIPPSPVDDRFQNLLTLSPSAAILDAWLPIEQKIINLVAANPQISSGQSKSSNNTYHNIKLLRDRGVISGVTYDLLRELQQLRNIAVHSEDVTIADAYRFKSFSDEVMRSLGRMHVEGKYTYVTG